MENLYIPSSEILSSQEQVGVGKKRKVREDGTEHVILSSGTSFPKSNVDVPINKVSWCF